MVLHLGRCIPVLIVLLVVGGLHVGCGPTTVPSLSPAPTRMALQPTDAPATSIGTAGSIPEPSGGTLTPRHTHTAAPTPIPPTLTSTCTATPSPTRPASTNTPTPKATPLPPMTPVPATATRTRVPPTSTPSPYRFLPAGPARPDLSHPCPGCPKAPAYIVGRVADAAGNALVGVRLVCYNEWHRYPVVASKAGGEYDFAIIQAETTWYVAVVDQADQPISPPEAVPFNPQQSCRYILDWQRVD